MQNAEMMIPMKTRIKVPCLHVAEVNPGHVGNMDTISFVMMVIVGISALVGAGAQMFQESMSSTGLTGKSGTVKL